MPHQGRRSCDHSCAYERSPQTGKPNMSGLPCRRARQKGSKPPLKQDGHTPGTNWYLWWKKSARIYALKLCNWPYKLYTYIKNNAFLLSGQAQLSLEWGWGRLSQPLQHAVTCARLTPHESVRQLGCDSLSPFVLSVWMLHYSENNLTAGFWPCQNQCPWILKSNETSWRILTTNNDDTMNYETANHAIHLDQ